MCVRGGGALGQKLASLVVLPRLGERPHEWPGGQGLLGHEWPGAARS